MAPSPCGITDNSNLSKPVAVDYTAFLFIYTFYLAEHNLINRTGIWATVVSHCCVILDILECIQIPSKLLLMLCIICFSMYFAVAAPMFSC